MTDTNHHVLTGKVDITSNLLVGSSHLFVDTNNNRVGLVTANPDAGLHVNSNAYVNTDLRVGSQIEINATAGRVKAASFEGDGSLLENIPAGADGAAATIGTPTITTGLAGTDASVTNSGTSSAAVFDFVIPRGDPGTNGDDGNDGNDGANGEDGAAATIAVGTTTPGPVGTTTASVINSGTSSAAVFDFVIPRGEQGTPGTNGTHGTNYFTLSGSNIYRTTGNVGIGTATPMTKLDIECNAAQPSIVFSEPSNSRYQTGIGSIHISGQGQRLDFYTGDSGANGTLLTNSPRMSITGTGNVGIGESDPESILHVQSDVQSGTGGPIKKTAATASTSQYNYILNGPRPGTTTSGAVHFINGSGRSTDGGTNKYTIRNDIGSVDIGTRSVTHINNHLSAPETYNAEQKNVDIFLNNGSIWMGPYTARHRDMGTSGHPWSQYIGKHYVGRILAGMEIENRNDRSNGVSGVYYSNLLHLRAHDHGIYEGRTMTIRGNKVGILTETPTYTLYVNGSLYYSSGGLTGSDDRIKYNEENITNALDIIDKLTPQKYEKIMTFPSNAKGTWIPTDENWENVKNAETLPWEGFTHGDEFGFIAQDVRNIPEVSFLVSGSEMETKDESVSLEEYTNLNEEEQGAYTRKYMYEENVITVEEYTDLIPENRDKCTPIYIKQVETQTPLALNYQGIFVIAVKAIQELKADLQTTKEELQSEKNKVATMELLVASLVKRVGDLENLMI